MTTKLITAVAIVPGAPITKGMTMRGLGFIQPVLYTLEDGTTVTSTITSDKKKDLPGTFERTKRAVLAGAAEASFADDGSLNSINQHWEMGTDPVTGRFGMIPSPVAKEVV